MNKRPPEVRQRISEATKRTWADPNVHQRRSEGIKRAWADPEVRQRISNEIKRSRANPEVRQRISEGQKRLLADPGVRQRRSEAMKRAWANPEVQQRMRDGIKRALSHPEVRQRITKGSKAYWTTERRLTLSIWARNVWGERQAALQAAGRWGVPDRDEKTRVLRRGETPAPGEYVISASEVDVHSGFVAGIAAFWRRVTESGMLVYPPPPLLPFEDVMYYLQRQSHHLIHCANPLCPAPYFFKMDGYERRSIAAKIARIPRGLRAKVSGGTKWARQNGTLVSRKQKEGPTDESLQKR